MRALSLPARADRAPPPPSPCGEGKKIRICFLIDELATAGTETQLLALIRHLDRGRFRPYLVLLRGQSAASRALEPDCCPVLRLGVGSLRNPATLPKAVNFSRFLKKERIDVLQVYFPDSTYFGLLAGWSAGVRHRIRTRNNVGHWLTPLHRLLGRAFNLLTTKTVANCRAARAALLAAERPAPESVVVLENGVDLERFLSLEPPDVWDPAGPVRVGAVANLRHVKGLDVLLRVFARLAPDFQGMTLHLGGEGEERAALEEAARAAGLARRVEFFGRVNDVPGFLATLDIAVLPSRAEGMSNALLEYMAAARPLVATATGATPELIESGRQGLLVPPGDELALADALGRLLSAPEYAISLAVAARQRAAERHSRAAMVRRFEDFYQTLMSQRGRG
jgi:glycosyltransferase involved in cell wall biosynthesis